MPQDVTALSGVRGLIANWEILPKQGSGFSLVLQRMALSQLKVNFTLFHILP